MQAALDFLNTADANAVHDALLRCCGSPDWVADMIARRPFNSVEQLLTTADTIWNGLDRSAWLDAFAQHPRIGGDDADRPAFAATHAWSSTEQAGMRDADHSVRQRLAARNDEYFERFSYVFLICATGLSADDMLVALLDRLKNAPEAELAIAAEQQRLILQLRLHKLLADMITISTHVLDLTSGRPATDITVALTHIDTDGQLNDIATATTDEDGRIAGFTGTTGLTPGLYQLQFDTAAYFEQRGIAAFYPQVTIAFTVTELTHHHVPLLLSPFGYSTYRGS